MRNRNAILLVFFLTTFMLLECGNILAVTMLLKNGAIVNAKTNNGSTPLSSAEKYGHARMVELLKANGAK